MQAKQNFNPTIHYAVSPDNRTLVTDGLLDSLVLWDMALQQKIATLQGSQFLFFFPSEELLVTGSSFTQDIPVWDLALQEQIRALNMAGFFKRGFFAGPDNLLVIFTQDIDSLDPRFHFWDVEQGEKRYEIALPDVHTPIFSPDGRWMGMHNLLWPLNQPRPTHQLRLETNEYIKAFSADNRTMVYAQDNNLYFYDLLDQQVNHSMDVEGPIRSCFFTADGNTLVVVGEEQVDVWAYPALERLHRLAVHVEGETIHPNDQWLATHNGATVQLWQLPSLRSGGTLEGHAGAITTMTFSPDGHNLITTSDDRTLMVWERNSNTAVAPHKEDKSTVPQQNQLMASFPNPANPQVWLPYALSQSGVGKIKIFNITGQLMAQIDLGWRAAGYYTGAAAAYWDGHDTTGRPAASGLYIAVLESRLASVATKLVLLR